MNAYKGTINLILLSLGEVVGNQSTFEGINFLFLCSV